MNKEKRIKELNTEDFLLEKVDISELDLNNSVNLYLKEIGGYKLLTPEEECEIAKRVAEGDEVAREILINSNLRLVVNVAKYYNNRGIPLIDLIQEGNTGLMKAVEKFDHTKGYKFSTYATWWIKHALTRALADQSRTIRIPVHMVETLNKLLRVYKHLEQGLDREPTIEEIAETINFKSEKIKEIQTKLYKMEEFQQMCNLVDDKLFKDCIIGFIDFFNREEEDEETKDENEAIIRCIFDLYKPNKKLPTVEEIENKINMTEEKIKEVLALDKNISSLDAKVGNDGENTLQDFIEEDISLDEVVEKSLNASEVEKVLSTLPKRTREIIKLRFGFDGKGERTLEQIAKVYDISRERVRQIIKKQLADPVFQRRLLKAVDMQAVYLNENECKLVQVAK